jgi:microcystin-dependent protein
MNPFLGQLMLCPWSFTARGWAFCNGQQMSIVQNQALFALLGTFYGGDGIRTFAVPNLLGMTPIGIGVDQSGNEYSIGTMGGEALHTLNLQEVPPHTHTVNASKAAANSTTPQGGMLAGTSVFTATANLSGMNGGVILPTGGNQPHENRQPYLVMNWCIALQGIFPSQN